MRQKRVPGGRTRPVKIFYQMPKKYAAFGVQTMKTCLEVACVDPLTGGVIIFSGVEKAAEYYQVKRNSISVAMLHRRLFDNKFFCYALQLPAFMDWEMNRVAPWASKILEAPPLEPHYRGISFSGVPYRGPIASWTG
jgi:hypothetical protein